MEAESHIEIRNKAVSECRKAIEDLGADVSEVFESLTEEVNWSRRKCPPPRLVRCPDKIELHWGSELTSFLRATVRLDDLRTVDLFAKKISRDEDDEYTQTTQGVIKAIPLESHHKNGVKLDQPEIAYTFSVPAAFLDVIAEKEEFSKDRPANLKLGLHNKHQKDRVMWGWHTDYYDGPLSGYCYVAGRLAHFDLAEETDYSGDRLFAVRELSMLERMRAHARHRYWQLRMSRPLAPLTHWWWKVGRKKLWEIFPSTAPAYMIEDTAQQEAVYQQIRAKRDRWRAAHKLLGHFAWE